ncbi:MAG: type II toxin-antitoxin system RelE/ParE family toxin [Bacteroidaceae bacterium]|nr:type II toxin-antitoxin system RelE/ParE family toxin [Bacteroidaceae bacterium]
MAVVKLTERAKAVRKELYVRGATEYGTFTALKMARKIESLTDALSLFPGMGFREPLLEKRTPIYRATLINKRFKIIYWYNEANDMVVIEDIWDTRRAPQNLIKRINNK